jgi:transposase InsO family protein
VAETAGVCAEFAVKSRARLEAENLLVSTAALTELEDLPAQPCSGIASVDLFVVPTAFFKLLYGLVILGHERRRLIGFGVTAYPTAEWIARQVTDAFPWDEAPRYLIRDRDGAFGPAYTRRVRAMGIRDRPTAARSPWQNGHAERLIGSIRRDCLDHVVVFSEAHLRCVLRAYASYYNRDSYYPTWLCH